MRTPSSPVHAPVQSRAAILQDMDANHRTSTFPPETAEGTGPATGDVVLAPDGPVGRVVQVLRTETGIPTHVVVSVGRIRRRFPVVSCALITAIDGGEGLIRVRGSRRVVAALPEAFPLVV